MKKLWWWLLDEWCAAGATTWWGDFELVWRDGLPYVEPYPHFRDDQE